MIYKHGHCDRYNIAIKSESNESGSEARFFIDPGEKIIALQLPSMTLKRLERN